jgi:D-alanine--poly(phosphoribitol) ligase subunit 1
MKDILKQIFDNFIKYSNNKAIIVKDVTYTYSQFSVIISGIQSKLIQNDIKNTVGIIVEDDINTYAAIFAIWFNGGSYVPLNCTNPISRNNQIIKEANLETVIISSLKQKRMLNNNINVIETQNIDSISEISLNREASQSLAYILYTSGSTGTPKGVSITFTNINSFIASMNKTDISFSEEDKFLQMFDLTFDVSIACLLMPLSYGASLYTLPYGQIKFNYVFKLLKESEISVVTIVPSLISYLKPYIDDIKFPNVRQCILTAEASYFEDVKLFEKVIPNANIYNFYGPTEGTIWTHYYKWIKYQENLSYNGLLSIGKSLANVKSIIINEENEIVKNGDKGELCLSGYQITEGYNNNEKNNHSSFFNKNIKNQDIRFYKTGDICFKDDRNNYMYCGRIDSQVQIQGFRVELGDIEHSVRKKYKVKNILSLTKKDHLNRNQIYLFIEDLSKNITSNKIKEYLKNHIPGYMIPKKIYVMEKFPINSSSKVDKKKLKTYLET